MLHLFTPWNQSLQYCYSVESTAPLTALQISVLKQIVADGFVGESISERADDSNFDIVIIGPRLSVTTPFSTHLVGICQRVGLSEVVRIERFRRYQLPEGADREQFIAEHHDRMTECAYSGLVEVFETGVLPEPNYVIPLLEEGPDVFLRFTEEGLDKLAPDERLFYHGYFVGEEKRNPTIAEMMDLLNANSEHSRHGYFRGQQIIDGVVMPETLMQIVQSPLAANPGNSVIAFSDNSSALRGYACRTLVPYQPGRVSPFVVRNVLFDILFTAETHNHPTSKAPSPGAETGTGGRIRDVQATGRGGLMIAGTVGYCVGNLQIPGYKLPWENKDFRYSPDVATPLQIEIEASNGASDYGNKIGEPVIVGFTRSFGMQLVGGRWEWLKPIMFTGGIGMIDARHLRKNEAQKGMLIVQIGGPAYRIGVGGGAASSLSLGDNSSELDFKSVQRGDAQMEQKMNRVIRACIEMGEANPIESIHDQGAGGPANVLKELVEKAGGKIELRRINSGDPTLSVAEIWVAEYQERNGLLLSPSRIDEFKSICEAEGVNCEVLGEVTGDGRFVVHDEQDGSTPVNLDLREVLGNMPQKTFQDTRIAPVLLPFVWPKGLTVEKALYLVLRLLSVGSKEFLTRKVDRSVTGLVIRQQCCGPLQLPVSDYGIVAQSYLEQTGAVTSIGEQPIKMLVDPKAGARMAVSEAVANMACALIPSIGHIKCSGNWMWAPKQPGEGAALYDAASVVRELMIALGIAIDGGKDSLSMAARVGNEMVKSPRQFVVSAYAPMDDVAKHVTPDIKRPGQGVLIFIDVSKGKARLGGSALAQVHSQIGDESPDVDDPDALKQAFLAMQTLLKYDLILSGHDVSDGGLVVTLLEMAFSGNCGLDIHIDGSFEKLFAEEAGWVVECLGENVEAVFSTLALHGVQATKIGVSTGARQIRVALGLEVVLDISMLVLRSWWQETSYQLERLQMNPVCADQERRNTFGRPGPKYHVSFASSGTAADRFCENSYRPNIAIIRDDGVNSDRELAAAFYAAGFMPYDVTMRALLSGTASLDHFTGLVEAGGFSHADVPESAKGWAATKRFNPQVRQMFERFYARTDTFSLGICNGCQEFALSGVVPWPGIPDSQQPRFVRNISWRFESRFATVAIRKSPAIMLKGMEGSVLGVWVAHGEGRAYFPDQSILEKVRDQELAPIVYVDDEWKADGLHSESYPFNPNGSPYGIAALCTPDGRHLAMMPHPERSFQARQWGWMPEYLKGQHGESPWMQMFLNAREWCEQNG